MMGYYGKAILIFILLTTVLTFNEGEQKKNSEKPHTNIHPVNKSASPEAKKLMEYIYGISGKYTLTGQHNFLGKMSVYTDSIHLLTGKYPAIWGCDFGFSDSTHDIDNIKYRSGLIHEVKKQYQRGSIITFTYHQANPAISEPCKFKGGVISSLTDKQWNDLLTPGTTLYETWRKQMDLIAGYLEQLRDANIPILFRPYHEMNGGWFWWGKRAGENGYKALWIKLFDYYTKKHKLNNLIWVWSPDKPLYGLKEYYPGDKYVDIVACDIYPVKDTSVVFRQVWYNELLEIAGNKPLAIGECGVMPSEEILKAQPRWVWFMCWTDRAFKSNTPENIIKIYKSDKTITLDRLPKFISSPSSDVGGNNP
jgi:mannan endo-1,4-beta-mannosidase